MGHPLLIVARLCSVLFCLVWFTFKCTCLDSRCVCLHLSDLPAPQAGSGPIVVLLKTHVKACGLVWPPGDISVAAQRPQMRQVRLTAGSVIGFTASELLFVADIRTHKADDRSGDKGLVSGVGGGLKVKGSLRSRNHMGRSYVAGAAEQERRGDFTHWTRQWEAVNSPFAVIIVYECGSFAPLPENTHLMCVYVWPEAPCSPP